MEEKYLDFPALVTTTEIISNLFGSYRCSKYQCGADKNYEPFTAGWTGILNGMHQKLQARPWI